MEAEKAIVAADVSMPDGGKDRVCGRGDGTDTAAAAVEVGSNNGTMREVEEAEEDATSLDIKDRGEVVTAAPSLERTNFRGESRRPPEKSWALAMSAGELARIASSSPSPLLALTSGDLASLFTPERSGDASTAGRF